jgi:hypothetical protein
MRGGEGGAGYSTPPTHIHFIPNDLFVYYFVLYSSSLQ